MDDRLRTALWNAFYAMQERLDRDAQIRFVAVVFRSAWLDLWHRRLDQMPSDVIGAVGAVRTIYLSEGWTDVYDFIDHVVRHHNNYGFVREFAAESNKALAAERSAYRIVGDRVIRITAGEEIAAIEKAFRDATAVEPARQHLSRAADLLSDRTAPDFRNSIKESISAVEAVCSALTGKAAPWVNA